MNFKSILVITYGRSGSTLLQGILNGIPNVTIRGENHNICFNFFNAYKRLVKIKNDPYNESATAPTHPWYGAPSIDTSLFLKDTSTLIRNVLLPDGDESSIYGFKEIRYDDVGKLLPDYLDFLTKIFPNPAFIFNTRNLDDVTNSGWWKNQDPASVKAKLSEVEIQFKEYANTHPDKTFTIAYEDVVANNDRIRSLFNFLGTNYDPQEVTDILSIKHSYRA